MSTRSLSAASPLSVISLFALVGLSVFLPREADAQFARMRDRVCLYEHAEYRGREECFSVGEQIRDLGSRRDTFSSIRIQGRAEVVLFEHPQFGGRSIKIDGDVPDLSRVPGWNDEVDSLRVGGDRRGGGWDGPPRGGDRDRGDRVCVYEHAGFGGNSQCFGFGDDERDLRSVGWNDKISSIRVFGRSRVAAYEHNNFGGQEIVIDQDVPDLSRMGWNDRISSLRVGGGDRDRRRRD
jgi:Beta/Gamma crystallin